MLSFREQIAACGPARDKAEGQEEKFHFALLHQLAPTGGITASVPAVPS